MVKAAGRMHGSFEERMLNNLEKSIKKKKRRDLTEAERHKFYQICYQSKLGTPLNERDEVFLRQMRKLDREACSKLSEEASAAAVSDYRNMWKLPS